MTANLLLFQIPSDAHLPDLEAVKTGIFGQRHSSLPKNYLKFSGYRPESFLTSLAQMSKDHTLTSQSSVCNSGEYLTAADDLASGLETGMTERTGQQGEVLDNIEPLMLPDLNLTAAFTTLVNLGRYKSTSSLRSANNLGANPENAKNLVALKTLIAWPGKSGFMRSGEMKAELARLKQLLANFHTDNASTGKDGSYVAELSNRQSIESPDSSQLIESAVSAQEDPRGGYRVQMGQSDLGRGPSYPFANLNQVAIKPAAAVQAVKIEAIEHSRKASLIETIHTDIPFKSEASGRVDSLIRISSIIDAVKQIGGQSAQEKLPPNQSSSVIYKANNVQTATAGSLGQQYAGQTVQNHTFGSESSPNIKLKNTVQTAMTSDSEPELRHGDQTTQDQARKNELPLAIKMAKDIQTTMAASRGQQYAGETVQNRTVPSESALVSKIIHDAQMAKEPCMRMDAVMGDEFGGKVLRVDVGANDNSLLNPQNQAADKSFEAAFLSKQTETAQDRLRTQALDQIVRKAVIFIRNGHHEAKIDLKPEFLGHVRLQVTTENQMVTVKILIESGFVKDMVEKSIHQLRADLQQHGLNVDKVEVAVSSDADEYKQPHEKTGQAHERRRGDVVSNRENRKRETRKQPENSAAEPSSTATVDYFA